VDTSVADRILAGLEHEYAVPTDDDSVPTVVQDSAQPFELNTHHWYFFYFNLFLLCFLICSLLLMI